MGGQGLSENRVFKNCFPIPCLLFSLPCKSNLMPQKWLPLAQWTPLGTPDAPSLQNPSLKWTTATHLPAKATLRPLAIVFKSFGSGRALLRGFILRAILTDRILVVLVWVPRRLPSEVPVVHSHRRLAIVLMHEMLHSFPAGQLPGPSQPLQQVHR